MNEHVEAYITFSKLQNIDVTTQLNINKSIYAYNIKTKSLIPPIIRLLEDRIIFYMYNRNLSQIRSSMIKHNIKYDVIDESNLLDSDLRVVIIRENPVELIQEMIKLEELFITKKYILDKW